MLEASVALTIDLDFFFQPVLRSISGIPLKSEQDRQQADDKQSLWVDEQLLSRFISYLRYVRRNSCFHCIEKHHDGLQNICEAVTDGSLSTPLTVINIDGHSDLYFNHVDKQYDGVSQLGCDQLSSITDEASWIWILHKLGWINKYIWIKPTPDFLKFAFPELPKSFIEAQNTEIMDWIKQNLPRHTWSDAMYEGEHPELLKKSFRKLIATRFSRSFSIEVQQLAPDILPLQSIGCITLCRSPEFTPIKADNLYDRIVRDSAPS